MSNPHKHAELIKAWADGADIEYRINEEYEWSYVAEPQWSTRVEFRIKTEPNPDIIMDIFVQPEEVYFHLPKKNLTLTFDGETGKLKAAKVIK